MRQPLIVGNWKMNGTGGVAKKLATDVRDGLDLNNVGVAICVPYVYISDIGNLIKGSVLDLGAQNVADQSSGAYTGEVSAEMLKEYNCKYAIVGHSERRQFYGDTNESVAERFCQAIDQGIIPIFCIGETLEEREQDRTFQVIDKQLAAVVNRAGIDKFKHAVIAYEPVWAIGTGKTATPDQAQEVHHYIRQYLAEKGAAVAENLQILYGGSVKPDNAESLFGKPDIDGALIGGASLSAEDFLKIYHST